MSRHEQHTPEGDGRTIDVLLAEYDALRQEVRQRMNNQLLILAGSIALATGIIPILQHSAPGTRWQVLLAASILFGLIGGLYFDQHYINAAVARYIHNVLRPRLLAELKLEPDEPDVFTWERWRRSVDRQRLSFFFRYSATFGVGLVSLAAGLILWTRSGATLRWFDAAALAVDLAIYGGGTALVLQMRSHNRRAAGQPVPSRA